MIPNEDYKPTMIFIILLVGLTLLTILGLGDYREGCLLEEWPLACRLCSTNT